MTELSPAARAVLTAVTLTKYDVPPEGLPAFAEEIAPLIAAAFRAAADQLGEEMEFYNEWLVSVTDLLAIATELEGV